MAITLDTTGGNQCFTSDADGVVSWSHTVAADANYIIVGVATWDGTASDAEVTGVTYNGEALTQAGQINNAGSGTWASVWYKASPATGSNTVQVTCNGVTTWIACGSISLKGVGGVDGTDTNQVDSTSTTCTITCSEGAWLIDAVGNAAGAISGHGASQTEYFTCNSGYNEGTYKTDVSAGSVDMTHSAAGSVNFAQAAVAFYPALAAQTVYPDGTTSGVGIGTPLVSLRPLWTSRSGIGWIDRSGIEWQPDEGGDQTIYPNGVNSGIGLGEPTFASAGAQTINPAGIDSGLGLGEPTLAPGAAQTINPAGAVSGVGLGAPTLAGGATQTIYPNGVTSGVGLGAPTLATGSAIGWVDRPGIAWVDRDGISWIPASGGAAGTIYPTGITSGVGLGTHTLAKDSDHVLLPDGIASGLGLGEPTLTAGTAHIIYPDGIVSGLGLGAPVFSKAGAQIIVPDGIASGLGLGEPTLSKGVAQIIYPDGVASGLGIGAPTLANGATLIIKPNGLASGLGLGEPELSGPVTGLAIEIKLYNTLTASATLGALVGNSVFPDHARQGASLPGVVYSRVSGLRIYSLSGYENLENPTFQFNIFSPTIDGLSEISDAIIGALSSASGFKAIPDDSPDDYWDDEIEVYGRMFDVSIWNRET